MFLIIFLLGVIFTTLFNVGLNYTNTTEFCTSCHTMKINLTELKETSHWKGRTGVSAGCVDCHVPKPFIPKMKAKIMAAKDVWHELMGTIDTEEKYEENRWEMANVVWEKMRNTNSRECRSCHSFDNMDFSIQDKSARKKHANADAKGKACIDCHKGVAHEEPDEPDEPDEVADDAQQEKFDS